MHAHAQPIGGTLLNRPYKIILALASLGIALIVWRFAAGLGATTALSDGYPWGLWIAFDVVTGTALACGGYAMALLVYVFNKGRYHPLVRPAVLTSALGYSIAGLSVVIDVGRPWYIWRVPLYFWHWNLNSALLEVALCIMSYVFVLWIELSPAFLERWGTGEGRIARISRAISPWLDKVLVWILALGVLLPTMHQSSLGSLIVLTGPKLNLLWSTAFLPLLFLISCLAMGYAAVVLESTLSNQLFGRPMETKLLAKLERVAGWGMLGFVILRLADLAWRGQFALALRADHYAVLFWIENLLMLSPFWAAYGRRGDPGRLFRGAMFLVLGGALFRFDTYLVAFNPGPGWHYFPSVQETFVTLGLVALEIAIYIALVRQFPILGALPKRPPVEVAHQEERTWLNAS
ncbi:MAG TPA: Ni/Fe-hydrogenase cytochrome b subunit [Thermoanaerobaculia bacterium]|jgi:Ni/Fe-hydrogenase subunit HybB-like protein